MTTPSTAILGIDLGTTEVKVGLVGLDGRLLAIARAGYALDVGPDGRAEQDPEAWWSAVVVAVHALRVRAFRIQSSDTVSASTKSATAAVRNVGADDAIVISAA